MSSKAIYEKLVLEAKSQNPSVLGAHFSPDVIASYKGQVKGKGINKMSEIFMSLWTKEDCEPRVLEVKELAEEDAVVIKAVDPTQDEHVYTTKYYFESIGGSKKIAKMDTDYPF